MKLTYCPECAAPLRRQTDTKYVCANHHAYYNNPRATCSLILVNDHGELLFAKRAIDPKRGQYDFPGGFLDYPEDAYQAIIREAAEELGIRISADNLELVGTSRNEYLENVATCDFVFLCRSWVGEPHPADDVATLEWQSLAFMQAPDFAWQYPYLYNTLQKQLKANHHV